MIIRKKTVILSVMVCSIFITSCNSRGIVINEPNIYEEADLSKSSPRPSSADEEPAKKESGDIIFTPEPIISENDNFSESPPDLPDIDEENESEGIIYNPEPVIREDIKFSELPFYLPDASETREYTRKFVSNMNEADSAEKQISLIKEYDYEMRRYDELKQIAYLRFSRDVNDETRADLEYLTGFGVPQGEAFKAIIESEYIKELEEYFGKEIIDSYREYFQGSVGGNSNRKIFLLENDYRQLAAEHFSQGPIFKKEANAIFSQMIELRNNLAQARGYNDYSEYAFHSRFFSLNDVQMYINNVKQTVLPVYKKLAASLPNSIDYFPAYRLVKPITAENKIYELSAQALRQSLDDINPMLDYLERNEMIDIRRGQNKSRMGGTMRFKKIQVPFVFVPGATVDTLIHDLGHAFEFWSWPKIDVNSRFYTTPESDEVASTCMEVIASENYELIYDDTADYARMQQIYNLTVLLLETAMNCEFELELYANPEMTLDERNSLFNRLLKEYLVGRQIICWQDLYIFTHPMYYISYSLDYVAAFELLRIQKDDPQRAKEMYLNYIQNSTEKNFIRRLKTAGFSSPFEKQNLEELAVFLDSVFSSEEYLYPE